MAAGAIAYYDAKAELITSLLADGPTNSGMAFGRDGSGRPKFSKASKMQSQSKSKNANAKPSKYNPSFMAFQSILPHKLGLLKELCTPLDSSYVTEAQEQIALKRSSINKSRSPSLKDTSGSMCRGTQEKGAYLSLPQTNESISENPHNDRTRAITSQSSVTFGVLGQQWTQLLGMMECMFTLRSAMREIDASVFNGNKVNSLADDQKEDLEAILSLMDAFRQYEDWYVSD